MHFWCIFVQFLSAEIEDLVFIMHSHLAPFFGRLAGEKILHKNIVRGILFLRFLASRFNYLSLCFFKTLQHIFYEFMWLSKGGVQLSTWCFQINVFEVLHVQILHLGSSFSTAPVVYNKGSSLGQSGWRCT